MVAGGTISILVTLILNIVLSIVIYLLVEPLWYLTDSLDFYTGDGGILERLFLSPTLVVFMVVTALQAPIPEEFAKALGPLLMGRRIRNERQAFALGLAAGAGFAILENMLYEGLYAQWSGWSWGGVTLLRAIGSILHPLGTGIITLAWFQRRERQCSWRRVGLAYLLSVGLHTLWNGGFEAFVFITGLDYYSGLGPSFSIYGLYIEGLLVIFLLVLSAGLWWLAGRIITQLAAQEEADLETFGISRRALAGWALACALVIVPIGAALGSAWPSIQAVLLAGW